MIHFSNPSALYVMLAFFSFTAFRLLPVIVWKFNPSDALTHLYDAEAIEKNAGIIPKELQQFFPYVQFSYPYGVAWLLYQLRPKNPLFFGTILNFCFCFIEFLLVLLLFLSEHISGQTMCATLAILAVAPNSVSPLMSMYGLHGRTIGSCMLSVATLSIVYLLGEETLILVFITILVLSVLISGVLFFSQFAVQCLPFVLFMLLFNKPFQFTLLIISSVALFLVLNVRARTLLKGQFFHVWFYRDILQYRHRSVSDDVYTITSLIKKLCTLKRFKTVPFYLLSTPALRCLAFAPWIIFIPILIYSNTAPPDPKITSLLFLVMCSLLMVPIINIKGLRFLGESDRYFYFLGYFPSMIVFSNLASQSQYQNAFVGLAIALSVFIYFLFLYLRAKFSPVSELKEFEKVGSILDSIQTDGRVLVVPQNYMEGLARHCNKSFVGIHSNVTWVREDWHIYDRLFPDSYPYPCYNDELYDELNVKLLVISKRFTDPNYLERNNLSKLSQSKSYKYNVGKVIYESENFLVRKI